MLDSNPTCTIVAIGNELTSGSIVDTNSAYLAGELGRLGVRVRRISLVEDEIGRIVEEIRSAAALADFVITTGGLGPTSDDLTREAVAAACGTGLERSEESLKRMKLLFEKRGRPFAPINERQADFPTGAEILPNPAGTADAFISGFKSGGGIIPLISVPGVPREMKEIFALHIRPWLARRWPGAAADNYSYMRVFGLSESYIGGVIESLGLDSRITTAYRPTFPEILLSFRAAAEDGKSLVETAREKVRQALGAEFCFSDDPAVSLPARVVQLLIERNCTIAAAESCTGGMLMDKLFSVPGASQAVQAGVVSYSNDAKQVFLGVKPLVLDAYGAVSREVAEQMAEHVRMRSGAGIGISITGIAGPDGGTDTKPVGTVWIGLSSRNAAGAEGGLSEAGRRIDTVSLVYPAERNHFRNYISSLALDLVRRSLLGYPLDYARK